MLYNLYKRSKFFNTQILIAPTRIFFIIEWQNISGYSKTSDPLQTFI